VLTGGPFLVGKDRNSNKNDAQNLGHGVLLKPAEVKFMLDLSSTLNTWLSDFSLADNYKAVSACPAGGTGAQHKAGPPESQRPLPRLSVNKLAISQPKCE
jgi:hypothetical protein